MANISTLFVKPIDRSINGVVKADQNDNHVLWQEFEEYVVTKELTRHFNKFYQNLNRCLDNPNDPAVSGQNGVWMSGFFGSGKSHFLKILSMLLENKPIESDGQTKTPTEFFKTKFNDPALFADVNRAAQKNIRTILFNIDSKADNSEGRDAVLNVFLKVFNEMQGYCSVYPEIAALERHLESKGKLTVFKEAFYEAEGETWVDERDSYKFQPDAMISALSKALGVDADEAEKIFENLDESQASINVETFAKRVAEFLDSQGKDARLMFFIDEMGQFIGADTRMMLKLQTLAEDLGTHCRGRAWIVVTSQEDIDSIVGSMSAQKNYDYSKIQGRFTTRLPLSSANTDEVIRLRILEKNEVAKKTLEDLYKQAGEILRSQIRFEGSSSQLKSYADGDEFEATYPFIPYQFWLLQRIFEEIGKKGAAGASLSRGERSMLSAFHSAANALANESMGRLVPLYDFYPSVAEFLESIVRKTIDQADDNPSLNHFDTKILKALFLIRYVDDIKSTVDNIVTLCLTEVDADRLHLKEEIEKSLERLERESLIAQNGDLFYFLTNEEQDIRKDIKAVQLSTNEDTTQLANLLFREIFTDDKHRFSKSNQDFPYARFCDGSIYDTEKELKFEIISPLNIEYDQLNDLRIGMNANHAVIYKLPEAKGFSEELNLYLRTEKYIQQKGGSGDASFKRILREFSDENSTREGRLKDRLERMILGATIYIAGKKKDEIKRDSPKGMLRSSMEYLVENVYRHFSMIVSSTQDFANDLNGLLDRDDLGTLMLGQKNKGPNAKAYDEIAEHLQHHFALSKSLNIKDVATYFSHIPYGWSENDTVLLLARMLAFDEIKLHSVGDLVKNQADAKNLLFKRTNWKNIKLLARKKVDHAKLVSASQLYQRLFSKTVAGEQKAIASAIRKALEQRRDIALENIADIRAHNYPGSEVVDAVEKSCSILLGVSEESSLIERFLEQENKLLKDASLYGEVQGFLKSQTPIWLQLKQLLSQLKDNEIELRKIDEANEVLDALHHIYEASKPYAELKTISSLKSRITPINEKLVGNLRSEALKTVEAKIQSLKEEIKKDPSGIIEEEVFGPLMRVMDQLKNEVKIPVISHLEHKEVADQYKKALDRIDQQREAARPKPPPVVPTSDPETGGQEVEPLPVVPQPVVVETADISVSGCYAGAYIKTEAEVEGFIGTLKEKLLKEVQAGKRVHFKI
jgi:hypothetical protein